MTTPQLIGLFEGYGGLTMGVQAVTGGELIAYSEIDPAACRVLASRFPGALSLGDITQVDWRLVDVDRSRPLIVTGGFPCQDVSLAGRRSGIAAGTRSGLWEHMARAIDELKPDLVVVENVRGILSAPSNSPVEPCPWCVGDKPDRHLRALGTVLGDLAGIGLDAEWCGLRASDVGAPHERFRVFIAAWPRARGGPSAPDTEDYGLARSRGARNRWAGPANSRHPDTRVDWGPYERAIRRWEQVIGRPAPAPTTTSRRGTQQLSPLFAEWMMGLPAGHVTSVPGLTRAQQLRLIGNGVVPQQAAAALLRLLQAAEANTTLAEKQ